MAITIKTKDEIEKMRIAGQLAASVLNMIEPYVKAGITTNELDSICHDYIVNELKSHPSPLNYKVQNKGAYPKSICTSVNHQVCHGIPNQRKLRKGDIINIDITIDKNSYHGDTSKMFFVGKPTIAAKRLVNVSQKALYIGIKEVKPGVPLNNIGMAIEKFVRRNFCSIVHEYCGHGIGKRFHEAPQVIHYKRKPEDKKDEDGHEIADPILTPGMIFTIEPMVNLGKRHIKELKDKWTVVTKDHKLSAQWEHTILVTETGFEILTLREEENNWEKII